MPKWEGYITAAEIQTRIDDVDNAIASVLIGQSYTLKTPDGNSQTVSRASLDGLRRYRAELERMLSRGNDPYVTSGEVRR